MNTLVNILKLHRLNYSISNKSTIPIMSNSINNWASKDGQFRRQVSAFRSEIKNGTEFPPDVGRYHLVVSDACPWAHRVKILRSLKGLEDILPMSIVHPFLGEKGWSFDTSFNGSTGSRIPNLNVSHLRDVYFKADPNYSARFTVPIIYDTVQETIVSNESSEIIRFLNTCFNDFIDSDKASINTYPEHARKEIDELNSWVYDKINNGVYKSGFASTQTAYESNVVPLFEALDKVEGILSDGRQYLVANQLTEADIRLYTTIVRFDPVYVGHFKCNIGTIRYNYPNINRWLKNLYWNNESFKSTTNFEHIKYHYYASHKQINGTQVVPVGPIPNVEPL